MKELTLYQVTCERYDLYFHHSESYKHSKWIKSPKSYVDKLVAWNLLDFN